MPLSSDTAGLFNSVIMAADRNPDDPVAVAAGVRAKALTPIAGQAMVLRVLVALEGAGEVDRRLLCGPPAEIIAEHPELRDSLARGDFEWLENRDSPSLSAGAALHQLPKQRPVLLTTADHALLSSDIVDYFCRQARSTDCDLLVALAPYSSIAATYPRVRRTVLKFRDTPCCSCNLFAFMTPDSRRVTDFWRNIEHQRKRPWRVMGVLGIWPVLKYLLGRLTIDDAMTRASNILGIRVGAIMMPFAEAAIDVDKAEDLEFVKNMLGKRQASDDHAV